MWKKFNHLPALGFFIIISSLLIFSWFRQGYLYGGGDVGLQTYNPQRILENARYVWWDSAGPGAALPQGLSAIPFQFGLFILQQIGFSPVAMQATLFFALLVLMGFGMYLFVSKLFPQDKKYPLMAGIFYMFNPYMMIQVWHRFVHTTIVLAAALPYLALFWNGWIKEGRIKYLLFFLLASFLSVYAFGTYAFILAVWIFLSFFSLAAIIPWQGKKQVYIVGLRFIFGIIIWILINAWWMIPVSQISPAVLSLQHKTEESLMTLITISSQEILPFSLQMINPFYLVNQAEFGNIYKNLIFQLIPWVFVLIIFLGLINSIKKRTFALYGIFYLFALFLAKGAASPFGNLFIFGFSNIFVLGVLRNPFEKTGLISVFFSTVLFTLGLKILSERFGKLFVIFICSLILIFAWPMVLGKIIGRFDKPAWVEVPQSYKDADKWLLQQKKEGIADGKILHLPLTSNESIQYNWKLGYNGLEPSDTFFTAYPSISRGFNIQRIDDALSGLAAAFQNELIDSGGILGYLQDFNVRFIVLHKDVNWTSGKLANPGDVEKLLDKLEFLSKKQQFGDLIVYQIKDQDFKPRLTIEHRFNLLYPGEDRISFWPSLVKEPATKYVSLVNAKESDLSDFDGFHQTVIFPESSFLYGVSSASASPFERLKSLQSTFKQVGMIQSFDLSEKILALSETLSVLSANPSVNLSSQIETYGRQMKQIFPKEIEINKFLVSGQESLLSGIFRAHLAVWQALVRQSTINQVDRQKIYRITGELEKNLTTLNLMPVSGNLEMGERQVFKFYIPARDSYDLIMTDPQTTALYQDGLKKITFIIGGKPTELTGLVAKNSLNFGSLSPEAGDLEISYPEMFSHNLSSLTTVNIDSQYAEIPVSDVRALGSYRFSGDVSANGEAGFYILLYENQNDQPSMKEYLRTNAALGWQTFQLNFQTQPTTKIVKLVIAKAENNLAAEISFKDVKVREVLRNNLILKSSQKTENAPEMAGEFVEFKRISPVSFEGEIKIMSPGLLMFAETFHPNWQLTLSSPEGSITPSKHMLGNLYGNAWYIDRAGEYKFKLVFAEQNSFVNGILLTGIGLLAVAGYWILSKKFNTK